MRPAVLILLFTSTLFAADFHVKSPHSFIAYGDMRFTPPPETDASNPQARQLLVNRIAHEKPGALFLSGDIPWRGAEPSDYATYASETKRWRKDHLHIYPSLGNHELKGDPAVCLNNWWTAFPQLRDKRWYSVQLGKILYALNVDSNSDLTPGSDQYLWISAQLAQLPPTIQYVFFNLHHPPVADVQQDGDTSHNGRPNEAALATLLAQSPLKSRVRFVVVAGHIHNYERFEQDGIAYLVSGGGGAKPKPIVRTPADLYQDLAFPNFHYLRFTVHKHRIDGTMIRLADPASPTPLWEEKDHFTIKAPLR